MPLGSNLAVRVRATYDLPQPATRESLLGIFRRHRVPYLFLSELREPAYYLSGPAPFALFQIDASAAIIAHEVWHLLTSSADQEATLYQHRAAEADAEAFASVLCEEPQPLP